ncbi:MAG: hydroxylamine reductase [Cyanobacteria bacterium REEB67]|nr:hydroxylamine reductase [Cyanobacteria bacterium REEB67]
MFCYQCEQTSHGTGCTTIGVCGKDADTAALQDLIVYVVKGISQYAHRARINGQTMPALDSKTLEALFMTLTNVNFDADEHVAYIAELAELLNQAKSFYEESCRMAGKPAVIVTGPAQASPSYERLALMRFAYSLNIKDRTGGDDLVGLQELVTYGVKGMAAYAHHAQLLGYTDQKIAAFVHEAFDYISRPNKEQTVDGLVGYALRTGEMNLRTMELLDQAHTETFGHPEPTAAKTTAIAGKSILVSGHDLKSLYELLKQTEGKAINVYTHGELLPALAYPGMKKFKHLIGNYGGAWQNQVTEFAEFPGAILMTTNCLKPPSELYKDRLFTMDVVGFSGIGKLNDYDFTPVIEAALKAPGFACDQEEKTITIGFAHNAVLNVADKVVGAVKAGQIRHFFLIGGCDGAESSRNYFTELAEQVPSDCVILTLGCGKYRFNMEQFGDIGGIPRLLDLGQCNDTYSAVKIAGALAEAFQCGINDLPLSMVLSWFEQKAVAVLLTLLFLGVKNVRIGPNLPAFITPAVLNVLVESFALKPVTTVQEDLVSILPNAYVTAS